MQIKHNMEKNYDILRPILEEALEKLKESTPTIDVHGEEISTNRMGNLQVNLFKGGDDMVSITMLLQVKDDRKLREEEVKKAVLDNVRYHHEERLKKNINNDREKEFDVEQAAEYCYDNALMWVEWADNNPNWHKCSDGLPSVYGMYICAVEGKDGIIEVKPLKYYPNATEHDMWLDGVFIHADHVKAWMPMPKYHQTIPLYKIKK